MRIDAGIYEYDKRPVRLLTPCARCGVGVRANGGTRHCGPCRATLYDENAQRQRAKTRAKREAARAG